MRERLSTDALALGGLRAATVLAAVGALLIVPLSPEHQLHLAPLLVGFAAYNAVLLAGLAHWPARSHRVFLVTLVADLGFAFVLVWFTGGAGSHFYLLFFLLVALNAYFFGAGIGVVAAVASGALLATANLLVLVPAPWTLMAARGFVLAILGLSLGHVAGRERAARVREEQLRSQVDETRARLARAESLAAAGRLSAKIAHEVRSPLGAITLDVDLLEDMLRDAGKASTSESLETLARVRREVHVLGEITEDYLTAARLSTPRLVRGALAGVIEDVVDGLRAIAARQSVKLAVDLDPLLPALPIDRTLVGLALRNLVKNAIEASPAGGTVRVAARGERADACVAVEDDGPGIGADAAPRLLDPFFTTKAEGTGLGLSIADEIARRHGGRLTWSNRPGGGACFAMRVPLGGPGD